jgi:hypothetical protein
MNIRALIARVCLAAGSATTPCIYLNNVHTIQDIPTDFHRDRRRARNASLQSNANRLATDMNIVLYCINTNKVRNAGAAFLLLGRHGCDGSTVDLPIETTL